MRMDKVISGIARVLPKNRIKGVSCSIENRGKKTTVHYIHGLGSSPSVFSFLASRLQHNIVRLSYPEDIISPDTKKTVAYYREILEKLESAKRALPGEHYVFGTSMGGFIALYACRLYSRIVISVAGDSLAEMVWSSIRTKKTREALLKKGYGLARLRQEYAEIEPSNCIQNLKGRVLIYTAKTDLLVPYRLQQGLVEKIRAEGIEPEVMTGRQGHYITAACNLLDRRVVRFYG